MTPSLSYPGVYIQEVSSGVRTIAGVATSITAFVGNFSQGPTDRAVRVLNFSEFEQVYGGLNSRSEASYAIYQFFQNGGAEAWISRAVSSGTKPAETASVQLSDAVTGTTAVLIVTAINPGAWAGDGSGLQELRISIDDASTATESRFNLTVLFVRLVNGIEQILRTEQYINLSTDSASPFFAMSVVNDENSGSALIRISSQVNGRLPLVTGTLSGDLKSFPLGAKFNSSPPEVNVNINNLDATAKLSAIPKTLDEARALLEQAIQAARPADRAFAQAKVLIFNNKLRILAGPTSATNRIVFTNTTTDTTTVDDLKLSTTQATSNVQWYRLGADKTITGTALIGGKKGEDGDLPAVNDLINAMRKLEDIDLFNILCIPSAAMVQGAKTFSRDQSATLIQAATNFCSARRALFLVDPPNDLNTVDKVSNWLRDYADLRSSNAVAYFPRLKIPDPLNEFRLRSVGPSGTIAGLYARSDGERGVWKAPAGTEANLINVRQLEVSLNDGQNGLLNPLAINCLRTFPAYGKVCWGARTLDGSDQRASEWKYVPVRRLALFLEESLYRGTQWVVFEPNDEPLWAQIRLNIGAFLQNLFRQGAFQGSSPKEAYYVKCDRETTTQNDINLGVVNILVGFAPLKPAEFVVIRFQQMAGQITT
jgi:phage tail sheath protein FI